MKSSFTVRTAARFVCAIAVAAALAACGDDNGTGPNTGSVTVSVSSTGPGTDAASYVVTVDNGDGLLRRVREIDDLARVLGMPARVEDDEPFRRGEHDRVAVGLGSGDEPAGDEIDAGRELARAVRERGRDHHAENERDDAHRSSSRFARRLSLRQGS